MDRSNYELEQMINKLQKQVDSLSEKIKDLEYVIYNKKK